MRRYISFIIILLGLVHSTSHAAENTPTFKLSGDVSLLTHYVENGLSQTDNSPALQGSFWFNFGPQFRMGLWGSNVHYDNGGDNFNLRGNADIKIDFSTTSNAVIMYTYSKYFNEDERTGNILALHLNFGTYRVMYDSMSNWEGTHKRNTRLGFGKATQVFTDWIWDNEIGYNSPDVNEISSYFDARTALGTNWGVIFFEGAVTGTSAPSDLNGAGDIFVILSAKTGF
ncbi:TorF family putative porin [Bdellovibrio sp. HCB209]|uniref:TorF family putative porin n=1 Tax=Bdellovibrio sp. HCB209 TaxID=3394354 RepID=UPI0039B37637